MIIYENNQKTIALTKNSQFHARIKYIDIQTHFIREKVIDESIDLAYIFTDQMIIDDLTKSLIRDKFVQFRVALEIEENLRRQIKSSHVIATSCENLFQRSHHFFLYNLRSLLSVVFACKKRVWRKFSFSTRKSKKRHLNFSIDFWESWEWKIARKSCSVWEYRKQMIQKHDCDQVTWCD